jgi:hypothetical protein
LTTLLLDLLHLLLCGCCPTLHSCFQLHRRAEGHHSDSAAAFAQRVCESDNQVGRETGGWRCGAACAGGVARKPEACSSAVVLSDSPACILVCPASGAGIIVRLCAVDEAPCGGAQRGSQTDRVTQQGDGTHQRAHSGAALALVVTHAVGHQLLNRQQRVFQVQTHKCERRPLDGGQHLDAMRQEGQPLGSQPDA